MPNWERYLSLLNKLTEDEEEVARLLGIDHEFVLACSSYPPRYEELDSSPRGTDLIKHCRFYGALIIRDLLAETGLQQICVSYALKRGDVQGLQSNAVNFSGMVAAFCERLY